jgi:hypothetical protein
MTTYVTTNSPETLIEMFLDQTEGEVYQYGRLATVPDEDSIKLVAYGNEILAEVNGRDVHLYLGHHSTVSRTVTDYVKLLGSVLSRTEGRNVSVHRDMAPTMGIGARASDSAQYISSYIGGFGRDRSPVEEQAVENVRDALKSRMDEIFG